jgi:hypothetical protein
VYQVELTHGAGHIELHSPADMLEPNKIERKDVTAKCYGDDATH